jgi:hypothetical protein
VFDGAIIFFDLLDALAEAWLDNFRFILLEFDDLFTVFIVLGVRSITVLDHLDVTVVAPCDEDHAVEEMGDEWVDGIVAVGQELVLFAFLWVMVKCVTKSLFLLFSIMLRVSDSALARYIYNSRLRSFLASRKMDAPRALLMAACRSSLK